MGIKVQAAGKIVGRVRSMNSTNGDTLRREREMSNRCVDRQGSSSGWDWEPGEQVDLGRGGRPEDV